MSKTPLRFDTYGIVQIKHKCLKTLKVTVKEEFSWKIFFNVLKRLGEALIDTHGVAKSDDRSLSKWLP